MLGIGPIYGIMYNWCCTLQVCAAAVGLMGDLCRALGVKVLPYCDETMVMLLENLGVSKNACLTYT